MLLTIERMDGVVVATPRYDVDAAVAPAIREELAASLGSEAAGVVLNLSGTRYVDSAGLDMIFRLGERLAQGRSGLVVVIPERSQLERLAAIVALPQAVSVAGTVEEAVRELADQLAPSAPGAGEGDGQAPGGASDDVVNSSS